MPMVLNDKVIEDFTKGFNLESSIALFKLKKITNRV